MQEIEKKFQIIKFSNKKQKKKKIIFCNKFQKKKFRKKIFFFTLAIKLNEQNPQRL